MLLCNYKKNVSLYPKVFSMISKFFKSEYYLQLFVLVILTLIVFIFGTENYQVSAEKSISSVFFISIKNIFVHNLISFTLIILNAILIRRILSTNEFINKKSLLPAFIFSFTALLLSNSPNFHQILISNSIIVYSYGDLLKIYNKNESYETIFNNSFLLSLITLIYLPSSLFIPIIWLIFIIFRNFKWREWIISIIGIFTPYFLLFSLMYLTDNLYKYLSFFHSFFINLNLLKFKLNIQEKIFLIMFVTFYIVSFFSVIGRFNDKNIYFRKKISTMLNYTVFCILILIIGNNECKGNFLYLTTSFSLFLTSYIEQIKSNWITELFYYTLILSYLLMFLY